MFHSRLPAEHAKESIRARNKTRLCLLLAGDTRAAQAVCILTGVCLAAEREGAANAVGLCDSMNGKHPIFRLNFPPNFRLNYLRVLGLGFRV
jgi:hypothetical protein